MNSIAGKANALQENIRGIFYDLIDTNAVKGTLDVLNNVVETFRNVSDSIGSLTTILGTGVASFTLFSSKGREMAQTFTDAIPKVNVFRDAINKYADGIADSIEKQESKIQATVEEINTLKQSGQSYTAASAKLTKYNATLTATKARMVAVRAMATLMNAAITAGISMLVSWGISAVAKFADNLINAKEHLREFNNEFLSANEGGQNLSNLVTQYKKLSEQMRYAEKGSQTYSEAEGKIRTIENQLIELYPDLNRLIEENADAKWKNVEAIEAMTEKELESAEANARIALSKNKISDSDDVMAAVESYRKLIEQRKEYNDLLGKGIEYTVDTDSFNTGDAPKKITEELEKLEKEIMTSEEALRTYYSAISILGEKGSKEFGDSLSVLAEELGIVDEILPTVEDGISNMGETADDTAISIDNLTNAFSSFSKPISMLRDMISEFSEFGGLTDETYRSVLESGNSALISLLADAENFIPNAERLLESLETEEANAAKELIDASAKAEGVFQGVIESANEAAEAITESMEKQADAISSGISIEELKEEYDGLINSVLDALGLTGTAAQQMEATIIESIRNYVQAGNELYTQDLDNNISALEAKQMASQMWANDEIQQLAQMVLQFKGQYDADMKNWANDIINKEAANKTYTDTVVEQIAEMIVLNAANYSEDTVSWASAIKNKSENNVKMVNDIIQKIAQMVLDNYKNYNADTVNWAEAVTSKSQNHASLCNNITSNMASVVNNLSSQYAVDAENFAAAYRSKIENLKDFNEKLNQVLGNEAGNSFSVNRPAGSIIEYDLDRKNPQSDAPQYPGGNKTQVTGSTSSTYQGTTVSGIGVSGGNYVGNVGSSSGSSGSSGSSSTQKEIDDLEDLSDRFYDVNNALQKVENQISAIETELESATGKDRIALLEKEIKLLDDKRTALINVRNEQQKELAELKSLLADNGFAFAADGQISNYTANVDRLVANANKLSGEAKENAIANVRDIVDQLNRYTDLLLSDIPNITNQINGITGSVSDLRDEIEQIIEDTTYFTKDFIDRYYELNNALRQVENQLNAISVAIKNADDNKMIELLDKQIELYIKQGEALAEIRKENVKELNELGKELYDAGFKFNADGTLSNYQSLIDKMVQDANKITDGKKQEKAIEEIENLIETIDKYTDLLLKDIPDITNDMDDLANAVIESQKDIADILSKQKDEYIDNLKEETEALKKEVERRKNILQQQWEQEDAEDELAEKQKKLNELEDQLTIALRIGDEELVKNIREQIAAAQKEMNDFIRDQERDYISDRFDEDLEKMDEDLNAKIDEINEKLSDEELLNLVQSGVRDLTEVLNEIENGSKGVRSAFAAIGTTISETWINALDTFVDKLNSLSDINLGFDITSKLSKFAEGFSRGINITQGNLVVQGNITEDVLPIVQNMIDTANNNLISDINAAFSR